MSDELRANQAAICWFYGYTPKQYRELTLPEYDRLVRFMNSVLGGSRG